MKKYTHSEKEIERRLRKIYEDKDGKIPNLSKFEPVKSNRLIKILTGLIIFFVVLAVTTWTGFFVFNQSQGFSGEGVELEIRGPEKLVSGEEAAFKIRYKNHERVPLGRAELYLRLPEGFRVSGYQPEPAMLEQTGPNVTWQLGSLPQGGGGEIDFEGLFLGTVGSTDLLQVVLTYKPANFNSEFQRVESFHLEVTDSVLDGEAQGADKVVPGDELEYTLTLRNKSEQELKNIKVTPVYPEHFILITPVEKNPQADDESSISLLFVEEGERDVLITLDAKGEDTLNLRGTFASGAGGRKEFKFQLSLPDEKGKYILQREIPWITEVIGGNLILNFVLNGQEEDGTVNLGDKLNYSITYANKGEETLAALEITANIAAVPEVFGKSILDWKNIKSDPPGKIQDNKIIWTEREIKNLSKLQPKEERTIDFSLPLRDTLLRDKTTDYKFESWVEAKIGRVGSLLSERMVQSPKITTSLNSNLNFDAEARYYNDDEIALGTGPLPPKTGEATTFRIFWKLTNNLHEIKDINVSSLLTEETEFSGKFNIEAGELTFDKNSKKVTWTINRMPLGVDSLAADFEVVINPTPKDIGEVLTLTELATLTAKDAKTEALLIKTAPSLDTNLQGDPLMEGRGRVMQ